MFNKILSFFKQKANYVTPSSLSETLQIDIKKESLQRNEAEEKMDSQLKKSLIAEKAIRDNLSGIVKTEQDRLDETKKEKKFDKKCTLRITYLNNACMVYTVEYDKLTGVVFPFRDFYTWYFSRTTPVFAFKFKDGETTMRRNQIFLVEYNKNIDI